MGSYKLSKKARTDLKRVWLYGVQTHGIRRADQYYQGMFDRFAQITEQPYLYQALDYIREGYKRSVYGTEGFITGLIVIQLKSWLSWAVRLRKTGYNFVFLFPFYRRFLEKNGFKLKRIRVRDARTTDKILIIFYVAE